MIRSSLFISNFKQLRTVKKVVSIIMTITLFLTGVTGLNRIYFEEEPWNHFLWKDFYEQENIDNIFIGCSHVFCDIDPFIIDEISGMNNFNLASGSLTVSASYYLLKEADRVNDLSNVYIELYYYPNAGCNRADSPWARQNNWRSIDYLKPSIVKSEYILKTQLPESYLDTLFPFIRYRSKLFDGEYINSIKELKNSEEWNNNTYYDAKEDAYYLGKGFYKSNHTIEKDNKYLLETPLIINQESLMPEDNCEYMQKIIDYCKKNGLNLKFFISPMYETQVLSSRGYDLYSKQVYKIAEKNDVELYDFNLCKSEYLDVMHQQYFRDSGHLNGVGTKIYTPILWSVLSESQENNKKYFCDSYDEKIRLDSPEMYGAYYERDEAGKNCTIASNTDSELEYAVMFNSEENGSVVIKDFSIDKGFFIKDDIGEGTLILEARNAFSKMLESTLEIDYK